MLLILPKVVLVQNHIILCGFGAVGQSLASLFESRAKELYEMHGLRPRIVGVFDSKGGSVSKFWT